MLNPEARTTSHPCRHEHKIDSRNRQQQVGRQSKQYTLKTSTPQTLPQSFETHIAVIGTGGIMQGSDAADKVRRGADLVQFYTGFVYRGPELVTECLKSIAGLEQA